MAKCGLRPGVEGDKQFWRPLPRSWKLQVARLSLGLSHPISKGVTAVTLT